MLLKDKDLSVELDWIVFGKERYVFLLSGKFSLS